MEATDRGQRILSSVAIIATLNWLIFWGVAVELGGTATNEGMLGGQYFVSSHGKLTQVTSLQWYYSYAHQRISFIGIAMVFATAIWLIIIGELCWFDKK